MPHRVHQPVAQPSWRPFFKWTRFLVYIIIVFILYHTFITLTSSDSNTDKKTTQHQQHQQQQQQQQQQQKQPIHNKDTDDQPIKVFTPLYRDFPWYKKIHSRVVMTANISTAHLTTTERSQLLHSKVTLAQQQAKLAFRHSSFPVRLTGSIPGSTTIQTPQATTAIRTTIDCLTRGQWIASSTSKLIRHVQDPLYSTCDKRFYKSHTSFVPRPETQYKWQPSGDCPLLPKPTPQQWCKVLNGRHILLVGDLVQYQLHELFLDSLREGPTVCFGELNCKDHTICSDLDSRLRYLRNDILADNRRHDNNNGSPSGSIVTWPFVASNILKAYPILLLNRSPIAEDDDTFISSLIQTITHIRRTSPDILIIYRSSGIGHPHCDDADSPLTKPLTDDELKRLPFGWAELERRNAIARVIVEEAGGVFVDLAALSDTRPDGHVGGHDCLRYCIPGPLDTWMDILYQVFASLA